LKFMKKRIHRIEKPQFDADGYQVNIKDLNGEALPDLKKLDFKPFKHGGARVGAGRKSSGRKQVLLRLNPDLISEMRMEAKRTHKTLSDIAEARMGLVHADLKERNVLVATAGRGANPSVYIQLPSGKEVELRVEEPSTIGHAIVEKSATATIGSLGPAERLVSLRCDITIGDLLRRTRSPKSKEAIRA
jgi:hypothetical protein